MMPDGDEVASRRFTGGAGYDVRMPTDRDRRRELRETYAQRRSEAGVYLLRNTATGRVLIASTMDLASVGNKLDFGRATGSTGVLVRGMAAEAAEHGMAAIELEVLDRLPDVPARTPDEVAADLRALEALWREQLANVPQY